MKRKPRSIRAWGLRHLKSNEIMKRIYLDELDADVAAENLNWDRGKTKHLVKTIRVEIREVEIEKTI